VKTVVPKREDIETKWYVIDAQDQVLGRLASQVAHILRGKHRPEFSPHIDLGDHVVVVNADKVRLTGNKRNQKTYTQYSGYAGGLRVDDIDTVLKKNPERVIMHAVKGMLPKNSLGRKMLKKLRVYAGTDHPHQAQKPEELPDILRRI